MFSASALILASLAVFLNGSELPQQPCRISAMPFNRVFTGVQRTLDQTTMASFISFDLEAPASLELKGIPEGVTPTLFPLSESNRLTRVGSEWRLSVEKPAAFVLDFGKALPPCHIFADPPFHYTHVPNEIYFGPGEHDAGIIAPTNGQTVCFDRGAVVQGELFLDHVTNVTVTGRGVLDSSSFERADPRARNFRLSRGYPPEDTEFACHACVVLGSQNVTLSGFVLRDTPFWSLIVRSGSRFVTIDNVKVIGQWRYNSDGIDISASSDVTVKNCFVRSFDDCAVVLGAYMDTTSYYAERITFENCRLWCDWGASFKLWSQPYTNTFNNITMRNCALLNIFETPLQVKDILGSHDTRISNIRFENIEVDLTRMPLRSVLQQSDEAKYPGDSTVNVVALGQVNCPWPKYDHGNQHYEPVKDPSDYKSTVSNIVYKDIFFPGLTPTNLIISLKTENIRGQTISDVRVENCPPLKIVKQGNVK